MTDRGIAVVGCGKQGEKHLQALSKLAIPICCVDADQELANSAAPRFGAQAGDIESVLANPEIGGLVIATPTRSHFALAEQAMRAGKHVFCEKPLTATLAEAQALECLETDTDCYTMAGFIYRFVPAFERLRELADSGTLGNPTHALLRIGGRGDHRTWKHRQADGGGVVNEMLVHMLDLAFWLYGQLHDVRVPVSSLLMPQRSIAGEQVKADAPDYVVVTARTSPGAPITFVADMVTPAFTQFIDAQFENASVMGSIQASIPDQLFLKTPRDGLNRGAQTLPGGTADLYSRQMDEFARVVATGIPPDRNRACDSVEVMRLTAAVHEQIGTHGH